MCACLLGACERVCVDCLCEHVSVWLSPQRARASKLYGGVEATHRASEVSVTIREAYIQAPGVEQH